MKKILIGVALIATLVSCGHKKSLYFAEIENKTTHNPEAEFDTLSYAIGMQFGVGFKLQSPELNVDHDLMAETFIDAMKQGVKSFDEVTVLREKFSEYQKSHMMEYSLYMNRKRMNKQPDTLAAPKIYDEEFTNTMFTEMVTRLNAQTFILQNAPFNSHYIAEAIRDAKNVEADSLIDATMKLTKMEMMQLLQQYQFKDIMENTKASSSAWLEDVAKRPGVQKLEVDGETLYYRINAQGGRKAEAKDSISVDYALYTYRGNLVESTKSRIKMINETISKVKVDTTITDDERQARLQMCYKQLDKVKNQKILFSQFNIPAIQHCLPLIGEYGSITIWAPAKFAPRAQGLMPGEGIVINIDLKQVVVNDAIVATPAQPFRTPANMPGKVSVQPNGNQGQVVAPISMKQVPESKGSAMPVKVTPVKGGTPAKVAPEKK